MFIEILNFLSSWIFAFWKLALEILPYYVGGVLIAGMLMVFVPRSVLNRYLGGGGLKPIAVAAGSGCVVPVCSCSVIPLTAGFVDAGIPIAPVIAFLVAAPMMNPAVFILTGGMLGWKMAIIRLVSAFLLAIAVGLVIGRLFRKKILTKDDLRTREVLEVEKDACSANGEIHLTSLTLTRKASLGFKVAGDEFIDLAKYLAIGLSVAALLEIAIPSHIVEMILGGAAGSVIIAALIGIPLYVCTCSEVPIVYALMSKGMTAGAGIAFMIGGPGVSIATMIMLSSFMRKKLIIIYASLYLVGAVIFGLITNLIYLIF